MAEQRPRIADNPAARSIADGLEAVQEIAGWADALGLGTAKTGEIRRQIDALLADSDLLDLPDRFNDAFAESGWIATPSFSHDAMRSAVDLHSQGSRDDAEAIILAWFTPDNINLFAIKRGRHFDATGQRSDQLREALRLTTEERYWSAVPLILIACDGFASDVLGTSPFEKDADLTVFDSVVGHPEALPRLIGKMTKGVRKSSSERLSVPLRHGILHGRSLGYANRQVCMKAWLLMVALVDWACDKSTEAERIQENRVKQDLNLMDLAHQLQKNREDSHTIREFRPRTTDGPFKDELEPDSPEFAFHRFLACWQARNYGHMARLAVNLVPYPHSKLAGQLRETGDLVSLDRFEIRRVRQTAVARAEADVHLEGTTGTHAVSGSFTILAFRNTDDGDVAMPSDVGSWQVQQSCMVHLMNRPPDGRVHVGPASAP